MDYTKQKAFTLVELIVVVTILAILATIGFVSYSSYLTGVRDTNRLAQLVSIHDGLELYRTGKDLPLPDENIQVLAGTEVIAYQGYAGSNTLETIDFTKGGVDPRDGEYFSYYLTDDRKYFQLMAFLEEEASVTSSLRPSDTSLYEGGKISLVSKTQAVDYSNRIPTVYGKKLGILTDSNNTPIQELQADLDLLNSGTDEFNMHMADNEVYLVTGDSILSTYALRDESLISLDSRLVGYYNFDNCTADDSSNFGNHGILNQSPDCVSAKVGNGYDFNGLNQYVIVPWISELEYTGDGFSFGFWINASSEETNGGWLFSKPWNGSGEYNYSFKNDATGWIYGNTTAIATYGGGIKKDDWQHVFVTLDGTSNEMKMYLNGENVNIDSFQSIASWIPSSGNQNRNLTLMSLYPYGSVTEVPTHATEGIMDEVYIYNRTLTEYEIGVIYRKD